jgi:hypothetical protein
MYKQQASIELPEINYLTDDEDGDLEAESSRQSTLAIIQLAILKQLFTPWTFLVLILFPFVIIGVAVWLPHVLNSCVKTRNGTVIARKFLTPLMVNNASLAGASLHATSQYICQQNLRQVCSHLYTESDLSYRQDVTELYANQKQLRDAMSVTEVLDRCVGSNDLDERFRLHCCGLEGYDTACRSDQVEQLCPIDNATIPPSSFRPVGEYLETAACHNATTLNVELQDSRFNCTALEGICDHVPCDGVDEELLRRLTIEADCHVEVHVIKCCLFAILALYHALFLNCCAAMAFRGVQHLRWRSLRPHGIQLRTHMNADGEIVKGGDRADRSSRIAETMRRFETFGRVQVVLSVVLFVVWIISFFVFRTLLSDLNRA